MEIIKVRVNEPLEYPVGSGPRQLADHAMAWAPEIEKLLSVSDKYFMVCTGSSGAMCATAINMLLSNPLEVVHIKKDGETSHSSRNGGLKPSLKYLGTPIIVDDFIASGATIHRIAKAIREDAYRVVDCVVVMGNSHVDGAERHLRSIDLIRVTKFINASHLYDE